MVKVVVLVVVAVKNKNNTAIIGQRCTQSWTCTHNSSSRIRGDGNNVVLVHAYLVLCCVFKDSCMDLNKF